jgi:hypothetical protein
MRVQLAPRIHDHVARAALPLGAPEPATTASAARWSPA